MFVHRRQLGDLARQLLVQQLPAFAACQFRGNQASTRPIFALYGDDSEHSPPRKLLSSIILRMSIPDEALWVLCCPPGETSGGQAMTGYRQLFLSSGARPRDLRSVR